MISQLEHGEIQYIFSVDIFNEGIDIPSVNQIIMLRRTESAVVFVQQLGRGLRLNNEKEFTLVLDFIGNYQKNYFIPVALSGDRTYNKDTMRSFIKEGNTYLPGCCTISFDKVAESRIFKAIDEGKFTEARFLKSEYFDLKNTLGRIPDLVDFDVNNSIDPLLIFSKYGSYHEFLTSVEKDYSVRFSDGETKILSFISKKLANGKRADELVILSDILKAYEVDDGESLAAQFVGYTQKQHASVAASAYNVLCGIFETFDSRDEDVVVLVREGDRYTLSKFLARALKNPDYRKALKDVIAFGLSRNEALYSERYEDTDFVLNKKYSYDDVMRLLHWPKNLPKLNIGGYKYDKSTNTFAVFINYEKDPSISDTIKYEDRLVSENELIALSKSGRTLRSEDIVRLRQWKENGMRIFLFMRKNKDDKEAGGKEFYFLGEMHPTGEFTPVKIKNTAQNAVEIGYRLKTPIRADIFDYLTTNLDAVLSDVAQD